MKKFLLMIVVALSISATMEAQELKFGHFDSQQFMSALPEIKTLEATIEEETKKAEATYTDLQENFKTMLEEYQKNAETMTSEARSAKEEELSAMSQKIQQFAQMSQQQLQQQYQQLLMPIQQKVLRAVQEVGVENGFTYIFESMGPTFIGEKSIDITPMVKAKLNIK
jgi:outer membrane protein